MSVWFRLWCYNKSKKLGLICLNGNTFRWLPLTVCFLYKRHVCIYLHWKPVVRSLKRHVTNGVVMEICKIVCSWLCKLAQQEILKRSDFHPVIVQLRKGKWERLWLRFASLRQFWRKRATVYLVDGGALIEKQTCIGCSTWAVKSLSFVGKL